MGLNEDDAAARCSICGGQAVGEYGVSTERFLRVVNYCGDHELDALTRAAAIFRRGTAPRPA